MMKTASGAGLYQKLTGFTFGHQAHASHLFFPSTAATVANHNVTVQ
jgi:hypothetical protein